MNTAQQIAHILNNSNTGTVAFIKSDRRGDYVEAMVPGQLNGKPTLFPEVVRSVSAAHRLINSMQ